MKLSTAIMGAALVAATTGSVWAQRPEARIKAPIDNGVRSSLSGTRLAMAQPENDAGRMSASARLEQMTIVFGKSAAQQSALDTLIEDQQNPASAKYHQWLSPDEFGAMFGAADSDIAKVQQWLQSQGFTVGDVSRNRSEIAFSGTIGQVETAFGTEMRYFRTGSETHFAPASDLTVPAALATAVVGVGHLNDLKPRSHMRPVPPEATVAHANFTSGQSGNHFVQPGDLAVIYDVNAAYSAGYTGMGQTIVVIGQSAVTLSDISNFQTAAGVPVRPPTITLMPNTGVSTFSTGDQGESDLDLEWTSAIAKGATINFIYPGNGTNTGGAFGALQYAITNKIGNIISSSYGDCEVDVGSNYFTFAAGYLQQAAAQGQTVISASGDNGSTDCSQNTNQTTAVRLAVSVDFPAGSQYVTALGGTEYTSAAVAAANSTYFTAASGSDVIISAKSYIPEQVWNDDSATALSAGGGGVSIFAPRPTWQTGSGITAGSFRLVPDISLASSPNNAGYLYCSSDTSTNVTGSCSHGFRDVNTASLTVAGGTSFAAPIFAGMLAIINQKTNTQYAGLINPTLYTLASNATTYASAFHDITIGSNACTSTLTTLCGTTGSQLTSYPATTGYDQATGLGSIDMFNLMQAWPNSVPLTGSSTTVTAATLTPAQGANDALTFRVASASSSVTTVPTGTVAVSIDGALATTQTLSAGTATYNFSSSVTGAHVVSAVYSGNSVFSTSTGTTTLTVVASTLTTTTTTLAAATATPAPSAADAITITVAGTAPTGTVSLNVDGATTTVTLTPGTTSSTATYSFSSATIGAHTIIANYLGDTANKTSTSSTLTLTVTPPGTFAVSAPTTTLTAGSTVSETITVTPSGGFTGAVKFTLTTSPLIVNSCYTVSNATITGTTAVTTTATLYTDSTTCPAGATALLKTSGTKIAAVSQEPLPMRSVPVGLAMAGLLAAGFAGRRSRKLRGLIMVALLAVAGFAVSGCGSTSTAGAGISTKAPTGTNTVTITATDVTTGLKSASTTFTLTIQ